MTDEGFWDEAAESKYIVLTFVSWSWFRMGKSLRMEAVKEEGTNAYWELRFRFRNSMKRTRRRKRHLLGYGQKRRSDITIMMLFE